MPKRTLPTVLFALSLVLATRLLPCVAALADTDEVIWTAVKIPAEGQPGKWVLANGSDLQHLTMSSDGTLYCYATPSGTTDTLFKSNDNGIGWSPTGHIRDVIIDIAVNPQDASSVYYATTSRIYKSADAGSTFISLPPNPGGAGSGNVVITTIDVMRPGASNLVAVSTRDTDAGQYGGVYLLDESQPTGIWLNTNIGNYDVYHVTFSPNYTNDRQMTAVACDETDTVIRTRIDTGNWRQYIGDAVITATVPVGASISFPGNQGDQATCFIALDTGTNRGDVYRLNRAFLPAPSTATALGVGSAEGLTGVDITSVAVTGNSNNLNLLAGGARSVCTYTSRDGGAAWTRHQKPPTGQSQTCVLMAPGFLAEPKAYATTCGTESAFSISIDGGLTWNQTSLIDSKISNLVDLTVSPSSSPDPSLFLITFNSSNSKHSLWLTEDGGNRWQRVFNGNLPGVDSLRLVTGVPQTIFLAGQSNSNPIIWKTNDNGQTFTVRPAPYSIDAWVLADSNTFFVGGFDGSKGLIARSTNGGTFYADATEVGTKSLNSLVLSPDYPRDKTVLVGNTAGQVFISNNNGTSFEQLGQQLPLATGVGKVSLTFDHDFRDNKIIYAATDAKVVTSNKERIFRFTIGQSSAWQSIYGTLPDNAVISQLLVAGDSTLYAVNSQGVARADSKGGILRALTPSNPSFETVLRGLDESVTLSGLWSYQGRLWSIDTKNNALLTINDSLTTPVTLKSPPDQVTSLDTEVNLVWLGLKGATEYEWQVSDQTSFASLPSAFTGTTTAQSVHFSAPKPATTYHWRVRATKPFQSPWSSIQSFTTVLGGTNIAPALSQPAAGMQTTVKPIFQWQTIASADRYELLVATDTVFNNIIINRTGENALPANAWTPEASLEHDTTYFWKVRACNDNNFSAWSAVSAFTTEPAPAPLVPVKGLDVPPQGQTTVQPVIIYPTASPTTVLPAPTIVQFNMPDWAIFAGLALLVIIILVLVAILALVLYARRS